MTDNILPRPDHIVEASFFSSDDNTIWSDISPWVELDKGLKIARRRQTVFDEVSPATMDLFLDNKDGTFNGDNPSSPFYGNVNVDVPVRFRLRWPRVGIDTNNMLSDIQSQASDTAEFNAEQGTIDIDGNGSVIQMVDDRDPSITYGGTWGVYRFAGQGYVNDTDRSTNVGGNTATLTFFGSTIQWRGYSGPNHGIATVSIDGGTPVTVDTYAATGSVGVLYQTSALTNDTHTIVVTCTGTKNAASSNYWVDVDAFVVGGIPSPPAGQATDLIWNTGPLATTGIGVLTGNGPSRAAEYHPVYVTPGKTYSARAQVKCDTAGTGISFQASIRMRWYDIQGNFISDTSSGPVTLTTLYQPLIVTGTAPSNAATVRTGVFNETVVNPAAATISFSGGYSNAEWYAAGASIYIPTTAMVGDLAMVWHRVDTIGAVVTAPAGWTLVFTQNDGLSKTSLYTRILTPSDIGKRYDWRSPKRLKNELLLNCYSGVNQTTPIHQRAQTAETVFRTTHTTPSVTTTLANCWIHSAVFDTSTTTTLWSAPSSETIRTIQYSIGGNVPNGICTDDAVAHAAGTYGAKVFTSNAKSRYATMHTVALAPATGTGPGNVVVQAGAFELVQGSLGSSWQPGGHWESKFTGFVDEWQETFNGDNVLTELTATDRQKVLNTITIGPAVYEDIRDSSPIAYYMLNESGSSGTTTQEAANSADVVQPTLTQITYGTGAGAGDNEPLQWGQGTGPGTDGTAALIFNPADRNNGLALGAFLTDPLSSDNQVTLQTFFNSSLANDGFTHLLMRLQDSTAGQAAKVAVDLRGQPGTNMQVSAVIQTESATYQAVATVTGNYFDGHTHMITGSFQLSGGQLMSTIYLDGVNKATATVACPMSKFPTLSELNVGGQAWSLAPYLFTGTMSHAAVFDYVLDDTTIADIWNAGNTAFAGDTVDQRIARLCSWEYQSDLNVDETTTVLDRHMPDSQTLLAALQQAARSEGGSFYVDGDGNIAFKSRVHREGTYLPLITVPASQVDPQTFVKIEDDSLLVNKPVIKRLGSGATTTVTDPVSISLHGVYEQDVDTLLTTDADANSYATYRMAFYSNPFPRCDSVKISALFLGDWASAILVDMWQVIRITGLPSTEASPTMDLFIEGWEFDMDHDSWDMVFDTSTAVPFAIVSGDGRQTVGQTVVAW